MNRLSTAILLIIFIPFFFYSRSSYAQNIPGTAGTLPKQELDLERDKKIKKRIVEDREKKDEEIIDKEEPLLEGKKTFIEEIDVRGVTLLPRPIIEKIIGECEDKEITLAGMQKICDLITDEYRKKGYVTSRAYLPPQTIKDGLLIIMLIEGKLGDLDIKGNRFFRTSILRKRIALSPGDTFDYKAIQNSLRRINEHPDRHAKTVLVPGKEPGTTDIIVEVEDNLPIHAGVEYDNFGSRYIEKWRFSSVFEHNNLLGFDDKFYFKHQKSHGDDYSFMTARYTFPIVPTWTDVGVYYIWNNVRLTRELKDIGVKGKSKLAGIFVTQRLLDEYNIDMRLNGGFDYKRVSNIVSGNAISRDEPRVLRGGVDMDVTDFWGRSIFTLEGSMGIPRFMGGAKAEGVSATRPGARGDFSKIIASLYRLQPMPFSSTILWKNQFQHSNNTLFAIEQFQIGGIVNVRGYPPAEFTGDTGYASSIEWSFPLLSYILPKVLKTAKVPFSKSTFTDATRVVGFYDMGAVHNNKNIDFERKQKFLHGYGFGIRFNLPEDFSVRLEFAGPLGSNPSDDRTLRTYFGINKKL